MAMETAAAILTKLAFEQNTELKSKLAAAQGKDKELVALMMPLFRQILSGMESDRQTHEKFPSAVPERSPRGIGKSQQPNAGGAMDVQDHNEEHKHSDEDDIGGEA
jgi:hypothetical protein